MNPGIAIGLIRIGLPILALCIGAAIGSHFGDVTGGDDPRV